MPVEFLPRAALVSPVVEGERRHRINGSLVLRSLVSQSAWH